MTSDVDNIEMQETIAAVKSSGGGDASATASSVPLTPTVTPATPAADDETPTTSLKALMSDRMLSMPAATITTTKTTAKSIFKTPLAPMAGPDSAQPTIANTNTAKSAEEVPEVERETLSLKPLPAMPSTSRHIFHEAAAAHGGDETTSFLHNELNSTAATQPTTLRLRSASSTLDATISRNPSTTGKHEKKIGHRRVDEGGEVTYKKIQSKQIMGSIQLGIQHTVGSLASKPKRDLLMNDFWEMETISFPPDGSPLTPAHHYSDFKFKVYAPIAFRYFRDLFGIAPDDFLMSMCASPLRQLSNPGASGSIFYLTNDDEFIIKTVQKKECEFLQKLLPGYYMNLSQNPRTLLPKFFGLYCFHYNSKNVRLVAMNNLLPSDIKMHAKYDLKGSTFGRKASKTERQKASPTFKDLDFMEHYPNGIFLETETYNALMNTIKRDCMVLESFQIMDYSLLVGIHNVDLAQKEKREERIRNARAKLQRADAAADDANDPEQMQQISVYSPGATSSSQSTATPMTPGTALNRSRSMNRQRLVAHSTAMESITADKDAPLEEDEDVPAGGIPARSENDERLILFIGIIDILQSYRLEKKLEHTFKSIIYNGDTVSVCRPSFYAQRFQNFMGKTVFKKTPTFQLKHSPSKRKTSTVSMRTPQRTPSQSLTSQSHRPPILMSGMSTPPPAFDDISEEDITTTGTMSSMGGGGGGGGGSSSVGYNSGRQSALRQLQQQRSYLSSNRSVLSGTTTTADDYSDDDVASSSGARSPPLQTRSPRLSKTSVQLTTIGGNGYEVEDVDAEADDDGGGQKLRIYEPTIVTHSQNGGEHLEANVNGGGAIVTANGKLPSTKTTTLIRAVQSQTYTTTLVVNDIVR